MPTLAPSDKALVPFVSVDNMMKLVHHIGSNTEEGKPGFARLLNAGRKRYQHVAAGFSLPPGIYYSDILPANMLVIPMPGLGVDRLTDTTENSQ